MTTKPVLAAIEVKADTVNRWLDAQEAVLVDVRETSDYEQEHIPGSVLAPLEQYPNRLNQ